jgi:hypothetical protein
MAAQVHVPGFVTLYIDMVGSAPVLFGTSRDGVSYTQEPFYLDVPGDAHGGDSGPPIDRQYLGTIAHISATLTRWDEDVYHNLLQMTVLGATRTNGLILAADIGRLMIQNTDAIRVVIEPATDFTNFRRNFPVCTAASPIAIGVGTKYSELECEFTAYRDPATTVLWNTTTS